MKNSNLAKNKSTIEDKQLHSNIGICKLNEISKSQIVLLFCILGEKKLIKRKEFEQYTSINI